MRILVLGSDPKPRKLRLRCCYCGCVFEALKDEYKIQMGQYNESMVVVDCPWCNKTIYTTATETR